MLTDREKQIVYLAVFEAMDTIKKDKTLLLEWLEAIRQEEEKACLVY